MNRFCVTVLCTTEPVSLVYLIYHATSSYGSSPLVHSHSYTSPLMKIE